VRVVELFGLPGAGKTTVVSGLRLPPGAILREDMASARKALPLNQLVRLILSTLKEWRWLWALTRLALQAPIRHREGLDRLIRLAVVRTWMRKQSDLIVLDQGPLQALWSIFYTEGRTRPPRQALVRVISLLYADINVQLIEIAVPPDIAATRITIREQGNSRLDGLPLAVARRKLEACAELPADLIAAAREAGLFVHSLPGDNPPAILRRAVQALVDQASAIPDL
jgi:hypothetical protein